MRKKDTRIHIPLRSSIPMISGYVKALIVVQIQAVSFILVYLIVFQRFILGIPITEGLWIAVGIAMVVLGLTLFLEGIKLGIMPLGEKVGLTLPEKCRSFFVIMLFGFLVGLGSTVAEPAIAALQTLGSSVPAWKSPLLYLLLEQHADTLVLAIGIGVGVAVIFGLIRFYYGFSIKPLIFTIIPIVLGTTIWAHTHDKLRSIVGLAWDSGAVTTGAVTVPLVLAIGIGVSRASGRSEGARGGFGIIMLASAFPILSVLILGIIMSPAAPAPVSEPEFFSPERRTETLELFESEEHLRQYVFRQAGEEGRRAYYTSTGEYHEALRGLGGDPQFRRETLGSMSLSSWIEENASEYERRYITDQYRIRKIDSGGSARIDRVLYSGGRNAVQAIIPLVVLLVLVLVLFLRESPRYRDEVALGIFLAIIGMALLGSGISLGLTPLGREVGKGLPRSFQTEDRVTDRLVIENFDTSLLFKSVSIDGSTKRFFYLETEDGVEKVRFYPQQYDRGRSSYEHVITRGPIFGPNMTILGIALVFLFAFGLGYGSSLAEPALHALGRTVEGMTVGMVKERQLVRVVALGVGLGLMVGIIRIMYSIPTVWLLLPPYLFLLPLTILGDEDFVGIAWDSGGVTTGPVTVPLVMAMGLGVGGEIGANDSFGILAMGSVYPILTVLLYSLVQRLRQRRHIPEEKAEETDE
jgi:hypothetical protein